ncbi:MAG: protein kinase [Elusimicrobia bacterium]|nr:protein kinase [Elusimicrobiota bacterium]
MTESPSISRAPDQDDDFAADIQALSGGIAILRETGDEKSDPKTSPDRLKQIAAAEQAIAAQRDAAYNKHPNSPEMARVAAVSAVQAGDLTKGLQYADRAVTLADDGKNPKALADALTIRAIGANRAGDYDKAAADAKRILDMFPKDKNARMLYESSKGRTRGAAAPVTVGAAPANDNFTLPNVWNDPRVKLAGQRAADRQAAIKRLQEAMRYLQAGDPQQALAAAQNATKTDPGLTDAYMQKALAWSALNELAKALTEVTKAIGLWTVQGKPENLPAAYTLRAQLDNGLKDYPNALSDADKALAYNKNFAPGWLQRAKAGEAIGQDVQRALDDYKRAAELEPNFRAEYEQALGRFNSGGSRPAPPAPKPADRLRIGLLAVSALLVFLGAVIWRLLRRKGPEEMIGFSGERKELDSQYDIVSTLGEGGMGMVYKGLDKKLKRPVAIKKLRGELQTNQRERERFLKEAELVASLHHPHIVDIYTIIQDQGDTYLVFEYVSGRNLHEELNETPGRRLAPAKALDILRQICEAVDHAHGRNVIHRDMKPSNVMLADGGWVKVMDFGIARQVLDSLATTTGTIVGTPVYMAPEQAMGVVVKESDVFALGITLYELLTGALPFRGPNEMNDKMEGRFVAPSVLVPGLGTAIDEVLKKALAARPEDRYHRCADLYKAVQSALSGQTTPTAGR